MAKSEPKELKLVCKCGDCTHWEIVLVQGKTHKTESEYILCKTCGTKVTCYFSVGAHEGLHYIRHTASEDKVKKASAR